MTKPLSVAAQAVLKAACIHHGLFNEEIVQRRRMVAAALRAAADYDPPDHPDATYDMGWYEGMEFIKSIANELESR